jgi:hypothetical protein
MVKKRRYNLDSSVTSCLKVFATSFAKIMGKNTRHVLPKGVKNAALLHQKSYPAVRYPEAIPPRKPHRAGLFFLEISIGEYPLVK